MKADAKKLSALPKLW